MRGGAKDVATAAPPRGTMDAVETARDLTSEQRSQLELALELHRPVARAANIGRSNARGYVLFGALTLMASVLMGLDVPGLAIGAVVTGVGVAQVSAAKRLRAADPAAPRAMARNELLLMAGIVAYALLKLTVLSEANDLSSEVGDTSALGVDFAELTRSINTTVYTSVIAVTLLYQGGLALYFLRRRPMLERYVAEAPEWARGVVESMGT
jgi:hypothetical protein